MLRFRLRTLLIAVAVLAAVVAPLSCQVRWIQARHDALERRLAVRYPYGCPAARPLPLNAWGILLLGERMEPDPLMCMPVDVPQVQQLFPEAIVIPADPSATSLPESYRPTD